MKIKKPILYVVYFGLLVIVGIFAYLVATEVPVQSNLAGTQLDAHANSVSKAGKIPPEIPPAHVAVSDSGRSEKKNARSVYLDERSSLESRFATLMEMAKSGDRAALHLAFQIQRNCSMWAKLSPEKFLPEMRKPEIGSALAILQDKCAGLLQTPESQELADSTQNLPNDAFDHDVREKIRQAFADSGPEQSVSEGLKAYRARPDPATAILIADTLGELDVINLDPNFSASGLDAFEPNYRRNIFLSALAMLACDYGEACGPNSEVVLSYCINAGVCKPGYTLDQIYENVTLSGEELQNVNKVLEYLRKLSAPNP
jgi:hypothetical protein